jgi:battenin
MEGFFKFFIVLFLVGLINNFSYVLISVGAQALSAQFGEKDLMPLFTFMLVSFNIPMLILNFRYLAGVNSLIRIVSVCIITLLAFIAMAACTSISGSWGFPVALLASLVMGMAQSIGECVNLGFLKAFPSDYIVGFTSGTGFAGIAGSGAWLICNAIGLHGYQVFLLFSPLIIVYFFSFLWVYRRGKNFVNVQKYSMVEGPILNEESYSKSLELMKEEEKKEDISNTGNSAFSMELLKKVWKKMWFWGMNLCAVYFLEYCIITGFADRATLKYSDHSSFVKENAFVIIQFCYQFGVWMSRSSLKVFKVQKVWIVTVLQLINWVVWWFEAEFLFLSEWGEFVLTVWVGLMGGLAYVNTGYLILNSDDIPKEHKEASMNVVLALNNLGVLASTIFCLILDNFIMKV